jgi:tetratricopeptide (TPR) repeat protein
VRICLFSIVAILAIAALAGGWFVWHRSTTASPPEFPFERMERVVADAIEAARAEVERQPRSAAAWGKLGQVATVNGYPAQAATCFAQAARLDANDPRWPYLQAHELISRNSSEGLPLLRAALQCAAGEQRTTIQFRLALALIEAGELDEAEHFLLAISRVEPDSPRCHFGYGLLAVARDDRAVARQHLTRLEANPFVRKRAIARLAALALVDGDVEPARVYQRRAARLPSDLSWPDPFLDEMMPYAVNRQARFGQLEQLEGQGRIAESIAHYREIVSETRDSSAYLALGIALLKIHEMGEAEEIFRAVIQMDGERVQAHHGLAAALLGRGEKLRGSPEGKDPARALFVQAVAAEDRAIALMRDNAQAHLVRGRALAYLGQRDASLQALREAVLCRPQWADTHLYLGDALAEAGQLREALDEFRDALRFAAPGDNRPHDALAKWQPKLDR